MQQLNRTSETHSMHVNGSARAQEGFTLLEVLIAAVVLSIGLLGVMALQANMLSYSHSAYLTSLASVKALDLEERMRANRGPVQDEDYDVFLFGSLDEISSSPGCSESNCGESDLAEADLWAWRESVERLFPDNVLASLTEQDGVFTLEIEWRERERSLDFADTEEDRSFEYSFRL